MYPYCTLNDFSSFTDKLFITVMVCEIIMLLDIIFNMLLAFKDDDDLLYITNLTKTSERYIYQGNFVKDFIIWIPIAPLTLLRYEFKYFQLIKCIRFQ